MTKDLILLVEDDPGDAALIRHAAGKAGLRQPIEVVEDGQAALDRLSGAGAYADRTRHPCPSLVLLDLALPRLSGLEVLQRLRARPETSRLPVVVLTASRASADLTCAYDLGANAYLLKPVAPSALREAVNALLFLPATPLRLLVIDDNTDDLALTAHDLRRTFPDALIEVAVTWEDIARGLEAGRYDLVVTDFKAACWNGIANTRLIKARHPECPVIVLTGTATPEELLAALAAGVDDYVLKSPATSRARLPAAIRAAVARSHGRRALRESEERFRTIFDATLDGILIADAATRSFLMGNAAICAMLGYTEEELLRLSVAHIHPPADLPRAIAAFESLARGEMTVAEDLPVLRKDGSVFPADISARVAVLWERPCLVGIFRDITHRKKAEAALVAAAREWQDTFDAQNDAVWLLDRKQRVIRSNRAAEGLFHRPLGEIVGKGCWEIVHGAAQPPPDCPLARMRKSLRREGMTFQANGQWLEVTVDPLLDEAGGLLGAVHIVRDITGRVTMEKGLAESERRFRATFEQAAVGMAQLDPKGRFLRINAKLCDIWGYRQEELLARTFIEITHPDDVASDRESLRRLLAGETRSYTKEKRYLRKDGALIWGRVTVALIGSAARPDYFISVVEEITDRKAAEDQLRLSLERLRAAVGITIQVVASAAETRDPYTAGHQRRVAEICGAMGAELGLPDDRIEGLTMAAWIHDIGKLSIPAEILSKPTRLSNLEFTLVKEHARLGAELVANIETPWPLAEIVHQHHERLDGSGYPRKLKGDGILLESRILAVADTVEAMASHRPYRPSLGIDQALEELSENRNTLYDPDVVDACLRLYREKGFAVSEDPLPNRLLKK